MYKLDRTAFKMQKTEEEGLEYSYWKTQPNEDRLRVANYLNSLAFNFDINNPPKMDKTVFSA